MDQLNLGRIWLSLVTLLVFSLATALASAQEATEEGTHDELITDRPDQTESAAVVGKGRVQIETGWQLIRREDSDVRVENEQFPVTLVRIGLSRRIELRVDWAGYVRQKIDVHGPGGFQSDIDGLGDGGLGVKIRLADESGARPELAILAGTSTPSGDRDLTSDQPDPSFRLSMAHTLSESVGLGYNLGLVWESSPTTDGGHTTVSRGIYTVAAGFSLSERVGAFVELFGYLGGSARGGPEHLADGGFTYLVRHNLQLDVSAGVGLNDRADDWFVGLGLSVRLPN